MTSLTTLNFNLGASVSPLFPLYYLEYLERGRQKIRASGTKFPNMSNITSLTILKFYLEANMFQFPPSTATFEYLRREVSTKFGIGGAKLHKMSSKL